MAALKYRLPELYTAKLDTAEAALKGLDEAGLPLNLNSLGIDRERGRFAVNNLRFLRNRYTLIDATIDLGLDREAAEILNRAYDSSFQQ